MKKIFLSVACLLIVSLSACERHSSNPLIGHWTEEKNIISYMDKDHKPVQLEFKSDMMRINEREVSVIYKVNKDDVVIFYRGESIISFIRSEKKMVIFIPGKGKRIYIKEMN
ncbi:MAG: hypothetical protein KZQ83_07980 [gamma proteobacterium symbiont of Taylorina sp.]|nr:hypothetical protein [gamma proteobacterium symbiont of Taylorina sp.]